MLGLCCNAGRSVGDGGMDVVCHTTRGVVIDTSGAYQFVRTTSQRAASGDRACRARAAMCQLMQPHWATEYLHLRLDGLRQLYRQCARLETARV
jgi:hypothetical protein